MFIDTHTHLTAAEFEPDRDQVIERAVQAGVKWFINIGAGYGIESAQAAIPMAERYGNMWCSVGLHPNDASPDFAMDGLRDMARHPKVVAIGETGLDYYWECVPHDVQQACFRAHIELGLEYRKPLIVHSRKAAADCIAMLEQCGAAEVGGVFHCFAEDAPFAERLARINFLVSFPGNLTFKNAHAAREAARAIPLEQIMLETDAPFLAPQPFRGKRCESAFMIETAKMLASLKEISLEETAHCTTENARRLFKIPLELSS